MLLNRTSEWKVMIILISRELPFFIRASRYIIGLDQTSESNVVAIWICLVLPFSISGILIYYAPKSDIRVKSYDHLNFSRASVVEFWVTRYIIGLNRTFKSKVEAVWICVALWCLISSILIYYAPESEIRVRSYDHLIFSSASVVYFRASKYIIALNRTSESKVVAVWIFLVLPCSISSISIYYAPESETRVKGYDHMNFLRAYFVQFPAARYIIGLNRTFESKVMAVRNWHVLPCLISSISIYYAPGSDIRV